MAAGYTIQGFTETYQLVGGNKVIRVREFHVVTHPSDIYFQFRRPKAKWAAENIANVASQLAARIEAVYKSPNVVGLLYSQDIDAAGQLIDMFTVFWQSDDGSISGSLEQPMASLGPGNTPPLVAADLASGNTLIA